MSHPEAWQNFSVQEFFSHSNWEGHHQAKKIDEICQEISWLCLKIGVFFSQDNWQGELVNNTSASPFSIQLSVNEFFQYFAWEVTSEIATLSEVSISVSDSLNDNDMKLENLSDLF